MVTKNEIITAVIPLKAIKCLIGLGVAVDATNFGFDEIDERLRPVFWSEGRDALNGFVGRGEKTGKLYAFTKRNLTFDHYFFSVKNN